MKSKIELHRIVATHPFLSGVSPSVCKAFCECALLDRFSEGRQLFVEGASADRFFLINRGKVLLTAYVPGRDSLSIQALGPGEALGWSWLFPPFQRHFSATAVEATETIAFAAKSLRDKAQQDHKFCYELVVRLGTVLTGRLEDVRQRLIYTAQGLS